MCLYKSPVYNVLYFRGKEDQVQSNKRKADRMVEEIKMIKVTLSNFYTLKSRQFTTG